MIYTNGCIDSLTDWINSNLHIVGGVAFGFAVIQVIVLECSLAFMNWTWPVRIRSDNKYKHHLANNIILPACFSYLEFWEPLTWSGILMKCWSHRTPRLSWTLRFKRTTGMRMWNKGVEFHSLACWTCPQSQAKSLPLCVHFCHECLWAALWNNFQLNSLSIFFCWHHTLQKIPSRDQCVSVGVIVVGVP